MLEFLERMDDYLIEPVTTALLHVVTYSVTNLIFYKINYYMHKYTGDTFFCTPLAGVIGLVHTCIFQSWTYVKFVTFICILFGGFFYFAMLVRSAVKTRYTKIDNVMKYTAFAFATVSFRFYQDQSDFDNYVITTFIMTLKAVSAARWAHEKNFDELIGADGSIPAPCEVIAYLMYTGWPSFQDFLGMRDKQHEKNERWVKMMLSAASRAVLYKVLSFKYVPLEAVGDFEWNYAILWHIHAFQYRCGYYYRAQLAELEIIAAGVKQGGWTRHVVFDFMGSEFSNTLVGAFISMNLLWGSYMRNEFNVDTILGFGDAIANMACCVFLVLCFDFVRGIFMFIFLGSVLLQRLTMAWTVTSACTICVGSCNHPNIGPRVVQRDIPPHSCEKLIIFILMQARLTSLFVAFKTEEVGTAIIGTLAISLVDGVRVIRLFNGRRTPDPIVAPRGRDRGRRRIPR